VVDGNPNKITIEDYVEAFEIVGCDGIVCEKIDSGVDDLWKVKVLEKRDDYTLEEHVLETPAGTVSQVLRTYEDRFHWQVEYPLKKVEDLKVLKWYMENFGDMVSKENIEALRRKDKILGDAGVISLILPNNLENTQWIDREKFLFWHFDHPEEIKETNRVIGMAQRKTVDKAMEAGINMFFEGIPGVEMISARYLQYPLCLRPLWLYKGKGRTSPSPYVRQANLSYRPDRDTGSASTGDISRTPGGRYS